MKEELDALRNSVKKDATVAWRLHLDLAMLLMDSGVDKVTAHRNAAESIKRIFEVDPCLSPEFTKLFPSGIDNLPIVDGENIRWLKLRRKYVELDAMSYGLCGHPPPQKVIDDLNDLETALTTLGGMCKATVEGQKMKFLCGVEIEIDEKSNSRFRFCPFCGKQLTRS